ncbi:MAG: hypothetical protein ACTSQ8_24420 [Candidatus Helarchaeota archaeon]
MMVATSLNLQFKSGENLYSTHSDINDQIIDSTVQIKEYHILFTNGSNSLPFTVEKSEDIYISSSPRIDVYEVGSNEEEAISKFLEEIIDYFRELKKDESILGPHLREELETLYQYFG